MKIVNIKKIGFLCLILCLTNLFIGSSIASVEPFCKAVDALQKLNRKYTTSSNPDLAETISTFVRTGTYKGEFGSFSKLNYRRVAQGTEKQVMFESVMRTALPADPGKPWSNDGFDCIPDSPIITGYRSSLNELYESRASNPNYRKDYIHQLTAYIAAKLAVLEWTERNKGTKWDSFEERAVYCMTGLLENQFNEGERIRRIYADPSFRTAFKNITGRDITREITPLEDCGAFVNELRERIKRRGYVTEISSENLCGARSIKVVFGRDGKPLACLGSERGVGGLVYSLTHRLGLGEYLAPTVTLLDWGSPRHYQEFIRLFRTQEEERKTTGEIAEILKAANGKKYGDLTLLRLNTYYTPNPQNPNSTNSKKALNHLHPDSHDLLFLHHVIFSTPDATPRNFLLQYRDKQLHLVRIDYGDAMLANIDCFIGEGTEAALEPFGEKGMIILTHLSSLFPENGSLPGWWNKVWTEKKESEEEEDGEVEIPKANKKLKFVLEQRLRILTTLHREGFFATATRADTIAAMAYIGLKWQLDQGEPTYPFMDSYFEDRGGFVLPGDNLKFVSLAKKFLSLAKIFSDIRNHIARKFSRLKPVEIDFIKTAIQDWLGHENKLELPGIKEALPKLKNILQPLIFASFLEPWGIAPDSIEADATFSLF